MFKKVSQSIKFMIIVFLSSVAFVIVIDFAIQLLISSGSWVISTSLTDGPKF